MKRLPYYVASFFLLILSCQKPQVDFVGELPPAEFQVSKKSITLAGDLNFKDSFSIQSNVYWTVAVAPVTTKWLQLSLAEGSGNGKIVITGIEKNPGSTARTATIKVTPLDTALRPVNLTIIQNAVIPYLTVDSSSLTFRSPQASKDSFSIKSNLKWSIANVPYWLSVNSKTGTGNSMIYISTAKNDSALYRTASLKITPDDTTVAKAKWITVSQGIPLLQTDKMSLEVGAVAGAADSFKVVSNVSWSVATTTSWLSLKVTAAGAEKYVVATAKEPNLSGSARKAVITVAPSGGSAGTPLSIQVTQPAVILTLPSVVTVAMSDIGSATATSGGTVTGDGWSAVVAKGICWSTHPDPTLADAKTNSGKGIGAYTSTLTGLIPKETYYVRAYATNGVGTAYGNQVSFTAVSTPPTVSASISSIAYTSATGAGNVSSDGGEPVTAKGLCWSTAPNPTTANSKTSNGTGKGSFSGNLTGLKAGTTYYIRAYATNSLGTAYSSQVSFTTKVFTLPVVTLTSLLYDPATSATGYGQVLNDGGAAVTQRGFCWSTSSNPTVNDHKTAVGTGTGIYSGSFNGFAANTTYYVRAYATNSVGTAYSNEVTFTTK